MPFKKFLYFTIHNVKLIKEGNLSKYIDRLICPKVKVRSLEPLSFQMFLGFILKKGENTFSGLSSIKPETPDDFRQCIMIKTKC